MSRAALAPCLRVALAVLLATVVSAVTLPAAAQPTFSKSFAPATIGPDSASALTFTVDNSAGGPLTDLAFTDVLPAALTIATPGSPANTCGGTLTAPDGGGTITLSGGTVGAGQTCAIRVDVTSSTPGTHTNNSGDLTSSTGNSGPATADLTVETGRPGFSKSFSPATVQLGGRSNLTFLIDNSANTNQAVNLTFSDTLPSGVEIAGPANTSTDCNGGVLTATPGGTTISYGPGPGSVAAGATCTVSVDVVATGAGVRDNRSGVLSASSPTFKESGFAVASLQVDVDELALTKSFTDDPVSPGGTVTLRFTLTNFNRSDSATGITFSDELEVTLTGLTAVPPLSTDPCGAGSSLTGTSTLTLAGGTLVPGETCTFEVTLQVPAGATPGAYPNTTSTVSGDIGGVPVTSAAATETLFVQPVPVLTKTFLDATTMTPVTTVEAGDQVILVFTVTNGSTTSPATNVAFTDDVSAFLPGSSIAAVPAAGSCGGGSVFFEVPAGVFNLTGGNLAADGSCTFQVTVQTGADTPVGSYTNVTSDVSATIDGQTVFGPPATADLTVLATPDLIKSFLSGASPGGTTTLELTLALSENSPTPATGISFTDDLDAALTGLTAIGLPADGFCGPGSTISGVSLLTVSGASLDPGESCIFEVTVLVPAGAVPGDYTNTTSQVSATIDGTALTGPGSADDLRVIGLVLSKVFLVDPVVAGGATTLQFTLDNSLSNVDATDISFEDDLRTLFSGVDATGLPASGFCGGSSEITEPVAGDLFVVGASVAAGASCSFSVTVQVPAATAPGVYTNLTGPVSAVIDGGAEVVPRATADLEVIDPLAISKTFIGDPVAPGETVVLEFTLSNASPTDSATGLTFTDDLDAALSGLAATVLPAPGFCGAGSTISGAGVLTVSGANLAPASSCTFQVTVLVPAGAVAGTSVINTTSSLTGTVGGVAASAPPASDDLRIDLVELAKSFAGPAAAGGTVVLTFEILNQSVSPTSGLGFTDDLDAALGGLVAVSLPSTPCGAGSSITGTSTLVFSGGALGAGESCSFDVTVQVPAGAAAGLYTNTTSELFSSGEPAGTAASADLEVEPPPLFDKSFAVATLAVSSTTTLSFEIDNGASVLAATDLAFTDNLPAGLEVAPIPGVVNGCGGSFAAPAGATTVTLSAGTVGAGATCTIDVDVRVTAAGALVNVSGVLTSSLGDSGTASAGIQGVLPELSFTKTFAGPAAAGGTVVLTFDLVNQGTTAIDELAFSDDLDATLSGLAAVSLPATPCGASSSITGTSTLDFGGGALGVGGSCSFDVTLQVPAGAAAGLHPNTTGALTVAGVSTGVTAADDLEIEPPPDFSKEFVPATVGLDGTRTLTFLIDNGASALPAENLAFTDDLPAGLEVAATPGVANTCGGTVSAPAGGTSIALTGGTSAAGTSCTISVQVTATATGTLVNVSGSLTSTLGDSGTATANLLVLAPEVTFDKEFLGTAIGGVTVELRFTITNGFTVPVSDLTFSDDLDAVLPGLAAVGLPAADVCGTGSELSGTSVIVLTGGNLPAGGVCSFTVTLQLPGALPAGPYVNVTSPLVYDREGVELEAAPATADLAPDALAIPSLGFWGLLLLAGVLGLLGWIRLR